MDPTPTPSMLNTWRLAHTVRSPALVEPTTPSQTSGEPDQALQLGPSRWSTTQPDETARAAPNVKQLAP
eukprot:15475528-Alexandrium_andersonii.AAC.1